MSMKKSAQERLLGVIWGVLGAVVRIAFICLVVMFIVKGSATAFEYGERIFTEPPVASPPGSDINVDIIVGRTVADVGQTLVEKGLVRDKWVFVVQSVLTGYYDDVEAGSFTLNTSMTIEEMIDVLSGENANST